MKIPFFSKSTVVGATEKRVREYIKAVNKNVARFFNAAQFDNITANWKTPNSTIDAYLRGELESLRGRSRDLRANNDYVKKYLRMLRNNVIGPNGFRFQVRITEKDAAGNVRTDSMAGDAIESAFRDWAKKGVCDVTGRLSFFDIQNLFIQNAACDGEALIRIVRGSGAGNRFGYALQVLEIDRLDVQRNQTNLEGGGFIKMGVEYNAFGRPVAYHLLTTPAGEQLWGRATSKKYERVPAEDIIHAFIQERPEQTRGFPWLHTALLRLKILGGFEEAAVVAARAGACKMGFITTPDGDGTLMADEQGPDGLTIEAEPGMWTTLPAGYSVTNYDPVYPHAVYDTFVKSVLRGVSSGLGVAYNGLANDLEGVNFSSIRSGVLDEREEWMGLQRWVIESFLDRVYSDWLRMALLMGAITVPPKNNPLPLSKFDKFNVATWRGRRWQWVDPTKDAQASILLVDAKMKTRSDVIEEMGHDPDEVFTKLAEESELLKSLGLTVVEPSTTVADTQADQEQNTDAQAGK